MVTKGSLNKLRQNQGIDLDSWVRNSAMQMRNFGAMQMGNFGIKISSLAVWHIATDVIQNREVVSGGAGGAFAPPIF